MERAKFTRFRASVYMDVWVEGFENQTLEEARAEAQKRVEASIICVCENKDEAMTGVCNLYVGGVAHYTPGNLLKPLDREI